MFNSRFVDVLYLIYPNNLKITDHVKSAFYDDTQEERFYDNRDVFERQHLIRTDVWSVFFTAHNFKKRYKQDAHSIFQ